MPDEVLLKVRSAVGMGDGSVIPTSKADGKTIEDTPQIDTPCDIQIVFIVITCALCAV